MKIVTITTVLLFGATATAFGQTPAQMQSQQNLAAPPSMTNPNRPNTRRPATIERETTGMGSREPAAEFLFSPGARDPQRNDLTVSPFGPMNNID
jgi:hypothetical protein